MRIVKERVVPAGAGRLRSGEPAADIRDYLDRVAKYIPGEVVAAYISANGIASLARNPGTLFSLIFAACLICTPVYISSFTNTRKEAWTNGLMAIASFIIWAYATGGGLVEHLGWYDAPTASVILILFTLVSGAIVPVARQEPPKAQALSTRPPGSV